MKKTYAWRHNDDDDADGQHNDGAKSEATICLAEKNLLQVASPFTNEKARLWEWLATITINITITITIITTIIIITTATIIITSMRKIISTREWLMRAKKPLPNAEPRLEPK